MATVTAESVRNEIARLESYETLAIREQFYLNALKKLLTYL